MSISDFKGQEDALTYHTAQVRDQTPPITREELEAIAEKLATNVDVEYLKTRPIPGGRQAAYLSGDMAM